MLDERLSLAAQLYEPCALGADIGTDHALLPCYLLMHNICQEMLLADVSPKALLHAEESVRRHHLEKRAHVRLADGLDALTKPCGCVSMMGMGGETIRTVLLSGAEKLSGAVLVLSSHTEQPLVRRTLPEIGYHIVQEKLCQAAGASTSSGAPNRGRRTTGRRRKCTTGACYGCRIRRKCCWTTAAIASR